MSLLSEICKDLVVVELANVLAGPSAGMFFAELGAKVYKIENKRTGGDLTRPWKLPGEPKEAPVSGYYCSINYKKEVVMADLGVPEDLEMVRALACSADIVLSNYAPAKARQWKLDYQSLSNENPGLIYAHLYAFSAESKRKAFDVVLQAETGYLSMTGEPGRGPVKIPFALIDVIAGHQLREGILLGLLRRQKTGKGCNISTSLYKAGISTLINQATNYLMAGHIPEPKGMRHPNIAPYGAIMVTKDGERIVLAVGSQNQFERMCDILGIPELIQDERFLDNQARIRHRDELEQILASRFKERKCHDLMDRFIEENVPVGQIKNLKQVFEEKEAREMVVEELIDGWYNTKRVTTLGFSLEE